MNSYEAKKSARIDRMRAQADRREAEANAARATVQRIGDMIPLGQPILTGHHSERRHRRDLAHIDANMRKSVEASRDAESLRRRADRAEASTAVSSDDPEAVAKLRAQLAKAEDAHANLLVANGRLRAGASPESIDAFLGWPAGRTAIWLGMGHRTIPTANSSAEIRRIKARIAELEAKAAAPARASLTISTVRIEEADNRVRLYFDGKPPEAIRDLLKSHGFRWAPSEGAWQRQATNAAWHAARALAEQAATVAD